MKRVVKVKRIISLFLLLLIPFYVKAIDREIIPREELNIYETSDSPKVIGTVKSGEKLLFSEIVNDRVHIKDKGWMDIKDKEYLVQSLDSFIVYKKMKLTCGTVPANAIIEKPYARSIDEEKIIIEYDGCSEVVSKENDYMAKVLSYSVLLEKQYKLYEEASISSDYLISVPRSAVVNIKAYVDRDNEVLLYTEYKSKKGWLIVKANKIKVFEDEKSAIKYRKNSAIIKIVLDALIIVVLAIILIVRSKKRNEENN